MLQAKEASDHSPTFVDQEEERELLKTQGTAPRRVRLQMKSSHGSVCCHSEVRGGSHSEEEDEVQSAITEVRLIK